MAVYKNICSSDKSDESESVLEIPLKEGEIKGKDGDSHAPNYMGEHMRYFHTYTCAEPHETFIGDLNINDNGECLFHSLLVLMESDLNFRELRNSLKYSKLAKVGGGLSPPYVTFTSVSFA